MKRKREINKMKNDAKHICVVSFDISVIGFMNKNTPQAMGEMERYRQNQTKPMHTHTQK